VAPLIINGTIYFITQFYQVFALNAANGNVIWTYIIPVALNSTLGAHTGALPLHNHDGTEQYTTATIGAVSGPTLWYHDGANRVWAINALTGKPQLNFTDFNFNTIDGNSPTSIYLGVGASNILIDQKRGILISGHQAGLSANNARCFYRAWNLKVNPPVPIWTSYCTPPQPGGNVPTDPSWTIKQVNAMKSAQIFYPGPSANSGGYIPNEHGQAVVDLKKITPAHLNATLYNDWGYVNQTPECNTYTGGASTGSTGNGWAGAWILGSGPSDGIAFVNTNNADPYIGYCRAGPNLWSASKLALNVTTGAWIWGLQAVAHDIWDYDCSWYQALANMTISGVITQVEISTCKSGYVFVTNAVTGNLIYAWTPPQSIIWRCQYCYMLNPLNRSQMSQNSFHPAGLDMLANPFTSSIESESAYNPQTGMFYIAAYNQPALIHYAGLNHSLYASTSFAAVGYGFLPPPGCAATACGKLDNTTVFGVDLNTGQTKWTYFIGLQGYRGGIATSGNIVFLTFSYGSMLTLNAQNGNVVKEVYIGGPLNVLPSIGATASGQMQVIIPITAGLVTWGTSVPGDIVALNLQIPAGGGTTTVTSTATSVSTTTVGAGQTVTTTVNAGGTTITTTVGAGATATVTSISTAAGGGTSSTITYGVAAVAVIFIITTAFFAMRGRKPAS
jgi:glucose dehydrogenase